jgi:hypothetical protein
VDDDEDFDTGDSLPQTPTGKAPGAGISSALLMQARNLGRGGPGIDDDDNTLSDDSNSDGGPPAGRASISAKNSTLSAALDSADFDDFDT